MPDAIYATLSTYKLHTAHLYSIKDNRNAHFEHMSRCVWRMMSLLLHIVCADGSYVKMLHVFSEFGSVKDPRLGDQQVMPQKRRTAVQPAVM